ncbi:ribonuclease P protein component [Candidatus Woesebacteria bacterium]|nr:ribonuclease P protein component [Candidatus Woesebacteria bacterium]
MLSRDHTLKGEKNFEEVQKKGKVFQSESFGVAYLKREDKDLSRFGFIVSNKVSPDAVNRNRIKRALSEAVRQFLQEIKKGHSVVFLVKQAATRNSTDKLMKETKTALTNANLTK